MLQTLASRNDDIRRLLERGYALSFDSNYLVVRDIPYLGAAGELKIGALATQLVFVDSERVVQHNHQVSFAGSAPHGLDGRPIPNLGDVAHALALSSEPKLTIERQFSNKPNAGYANFFDKIERYVAIISGPAMERYDVSPLTFAAYGDAASDSVFKLQDTLTTRAQIDDLNQVFADQVVAVIGLGGTGSYLLDFIIKTPVKEVRGFDADEYHVHNAFRSPGRLLLGELGQAKADVYAGRYENFRAGLSVKAQLIDESSAAELEGVTFAFVCVDKGSARAKIIALLIEAGIPFIDVGMGLNRKRGALAGALRATAFIGDHARAAQHANLVPTHDNPDDIYKSNIQIAELNALNAAMAVVLYKKHLGFLVDDEPGYNSILSIADIKITRQLHED